MSERKRTTEIAVAGILLVIGAILYGLVLKLYFNETEKRFVTIVDEKTAGADRVDVRAVVTGIDPIKGEMTVRVEFEPEGAFKSSDEYTLAKDVTMYVNAAKGKQIETFKKGHRLTSIDVVLNMYGEAGLYPFDSHEVDLDLRLTTPEVEPEVKPAAPAEGAPPAEGEPPAPPPAPKTDKPADLAKRITEDEPVPLAIQFETAVPGFVVKAIKPDAKAKDADVGYSGIDMTVTRTATVVGFSIFDMTLVWGLACVILTMIWQVLFYQRKIEFAMFGYMATILFALPTIRNLQPGVPPLGSLVDFLSLFWAQSIVILCVITLLGTWIVRK